MPSRFCVSSKESVIRSQNLCIKGYALILSQTFCFFFKNLSSNNLPLQRHSLKLKELKVYMLVCVICDVAHQRQMLMSFNSDDIFSTGLKLLVENDEQHCKGNQNSNLCAPMWGPLVITSTPSHFAQHELALSCILL